MSDSVQHDVQSQITQAAAQQRAALQVRRLSEEVRLRQPTAQSLEDEQLRAQQRRQAVT